MTKKIVVDKKVLNLDEAEQEKKRGTTLGKALSEADREYERRTK